MPRGVVPRAASCLLTLAVLLWGCGGDGAKETTSGQEPIVQKATPMPGGSGQAASDGTRLTILFTNNVDGEIEPCG